MGRHSAGAHRAAVQANPLPAPSTGCTVVKGTACPGNWWGSGRPRAMLLLALTSLLMWNKFRTARWSRHHPAAAGALITVLVALFQPFTDTKTGSCFPAAVTLPAPRVTRQPAADGVTVGDQAAG